MNELKKIERNEENFLLLLETIYKMNSLNKAIAQCVEIDRKAGRIPSLD